MSNCSNPQYDDVEAEITCLLLLYAQAKIVYEFSPCAGWSTLYILNATSDNATVYSYDLEDTSYSNIQTFPDLCKKWRFTKHDVSSLFDTFDLDMDYIFIDSDHTPQFARIFTDKLLTPALSHARLHNRKIFVSVHDVFHSHLPSDEGQVVIDFLLDNGISYFAPANLEHSIALHDLRKTLTLDSQIHSANTNPAIFFILQ